MPEPTVAVLMIKTGYYCLGDRSPLIPETTTTVINGKVLRSSLRENPEYFILLTSDRLFLNCGSSSCSLLLSLTSSPDSDSRRLLRLPLFKLVDGENQLATAGKIFDTRDFTLLIIDCNRNRRKNTVRNRKEQTKFRCRLT